MDYTHEACNDGGLQDPAMEYLDKIGINCYFLSKLLFLNRKIEQLRKFTTGMKDLNLLIKSKVKWYFGALSYQPLPEPARIPQEFL